MNDSNTIEWLRGALSVPSPFPWQLELLGRMSRGQIERALDLPTGLGKTAVMAIWLIARTQAPSLPRRLVYVVDRRAVVDQATEVANSLRAYVERTPRLKQALGLSDRALPISTLRGQFVDSKDWLEDPSSPAIIVGTVDMTGSRLLFEGYGTTRKMRPYQAGLLGTDTLFVIDEAHLVPPFEKLLEAIESGSANKDFGPQQDAISHVPRLRLLSLSATGRATNRKPFELLPQDLDDDTVQRRLNAAKHLSVIEQSFEGLPHSLASAAWRLTDGKTSARLIVFCNKREDAKSALDSLLKTAHSNKIRVEADLLVGGRRVFERSEATRRLKTLGFVAGSTQRPSTSAFLFATSAGEVGVDLDADHMVGDIVAWERMVQRLGRVNRRGEGDAQVVLIAEKPSKDLLKALEKEEEKRTEKDRELLLTHQQSVACRELLGFLPGSETTKDASPAAFGRLKRLAATDERLRNLLIAATTPSPLYPALTRALLDAWSMTSLKDHSGRPEVAPWLRGWVDEEPQTSVLWRYHLPIKFDGTTEPDEVEAYFEAAPPHTSEILETETYRVYEWLSERALSLQGMSAKPKPEPDSDEEANSTGLNSDDVIAFVLSPALERRTDIKIADLLSNEALRKRQDQIKDALRGAILIVDARVGGLVAGLLDSDSDDRPRCADDGQDWLRSDDAPVLGFRVDETDTLPLDLGGEWRERYRFAIEESDAGDGRWLVVSKWISDAATEEDRSEGCPQLLTEHHEWTAARATRLADRLHLTGEYKALLVLAARLHDQGKAAARWQRAFNARKDAIYAKTRGPLNVALLDGYRHELGSILSAGVRAQLAKLGDDWRDLAYHLIASHHGVARPLIQARGCELPPSRLESETREVALRYLRLQKRWGPWGLAWWESLLRAADQQASRDNDIRGKEVDSDG